MSENHPLRYTTRDPHVDRPDWAESYEPGDTIRFRIPQTGEVDEAEVEGFSRYYEHPGVPVITPTERLRELYEKHTDPEDCPQTFAITEEYHVPETEVVADGEG